MDFEIFSWVPLLVTNFKIFIAENALVKIDLRPPALEFCFQDYGKFYPIVNARTGREFNCISGNHDSIFNNFPFIGGLESESIIGGR